MTATEPRPVMQLATASGSSMVIQAGRDLYISDASLRPLWTPGETAPGECPFPGLDAFGPAQARWFFGRQVLTANLLELLDTAARSASGAPVLVVGPSGAGKSSLLGAGLMAALAEGRLPRPGSAHWPRLMLTPGAHPAAALAAALAHPAMPGPAPERTVIVVDQLEEIFTACQDEAERSQFLGRLAQLAAGPALVVLGLRADFYARATAYPVLCASMGARQLALGAMTADEVRQAITAPAQAVGLILESGLAERLLHDLGADAGSGEAESYEPGRLPLLAHALLATWRLRNGNLLTVAGYQAAGRISGAIAKSAEQVYARLGEDGLGEDGQRAARQVFLALVQVGEEAGPAGGVDTRRRVNADRLYAVADDQDLARAVVSRYTAARLLTSGGDAVQITHEALLRSWPRLRDWLSEDRAGHLLRQDLEEAAATWDRESRDPAGLYGGARLAAARAWASGPALPLGLSQPAREFLTASDRRRRRSVRRRNAVIAMLTALSVGLATVAGFALAARSDARAALNQDEAVVLSNSATEAMTQNDAAAAMEFAVLGYRLQSASEQARSSVLSTQTQPLTGRLDVAQRTDGEVFWVAYNQDGSLIAASTSTNFLQIWSASAHRLLFSTKVGPGRKPWALHQVMFSPDGQLVAVTGPGGAYLYRVAPSGQLTPDGLLGPGGIGPGVTAEAFSPNGQTLALAVGQSNGAHEHIQQWNIATRKPAEKSFPVTGSVGRMTFAAGGRLLIMTAVQHPRQLPSPGTVTVRDAATGKLKYSIPTFGSSYALAVSQHDGTIAFASQVSSKNVIEFRSLADHREIRTPLTGFTVPQQTLAFSPDGALLATGGPDNVTQLWNLTDPYPLATFNGVYPVESVAFSPDGRTVASGGNDGFVRLWNVRGTTLANRVNSTVAVALSPDDRILAVGTADPVQGPGIALYAMPGRKLVSFLPTGKDTAVSKLAYSRNGQSLAAAVEVPTDVKAPETVQLWDPATGRQIGQIATGQPGQMHGLAFNRDGTLLATTSENDATVRIWNPAKLALIKAITATQGASIASQAFRFQWDVVFSPNGRLMAVPGGDGRTRVYSVPGYQLVDSYAQQTTASTAAFSPDGRTLAIGDDDGAVYLYAVHPKRSAAQALQEQLSTEVLSDSAQRISSVVFAADGKRLVAAGFDGTVRIWDVPSGTLAATISANAGDIMALAYDSTRQLIVTGSSAGTHVWQASPKGVAAGICRALGSGPISQDLWSSYDLPGTAYPSACG